MPDYIMGIDEAGRGPVIGPMIICAAMARREDIPGLAKIGVKDSKLLSPNRREEIKKLMAKIIRRWEVVEISASQIDQQGISSLYLSSVIKLIDKFSPHTAIIDCPTCAPASFKRKIKTLIKNKKVNLMVENFADENHSIVSAASILAKVERDEKMKKLSLSYQGIGSGYPSDKNTIAFLKRYIYQNHQLPSIVRKRWKTVQNLQENLKDKPQLWWPKEN